MEFNGTAAAAAMKLCKITPAKLAIEAGVSVWSVYKTLRGVRSNKAVIEAADKLLQPQLSEIELIAAAPHDQGAA